MSVIERLVKTFDKSFEEKNNVNMQRILKDIPGYMKNVPPKEAGRALQILLDKKRGILYFIHTAMNDMRKHEVENIKIPLKEGFILLQNIIEYFPKEYEPYVEQTRDLCIAYIKSKFWFYLRKAATETLKKLIEHYSHFDLQLDFIVELFCTKYLELYNRKEGCVFYIVIGTIAKICPTKSVKLNQYVNDVYQFLLKDLKYQTDSIGTKTSEELKIYLNCYVDMLKSFLPFAEDTEKKKNYLQKLFLTLSHLRFHRQILLSVKNKTTFLLSLNMSLFVEFMLKEYKKWHTIFTESVDEQENFTNILALRAYYKEMAKIINKQEDEATFLYFKSYLTSKINKKDLTYIQLKLSVYGLGEFSCLYKKYALEEIQDAFQTIAKRALPFYNIETDNDFECVADFLKALTNLLRYMPIVTIYHINIITELSLCFMKRYANSKKTQDKKYANNTLKTAFFHISHLEKCHQQDYFTSFFREGLLQACTQTLLIDVEIRQEIEGLFEKPISYKNYSSLWIDLLQTNDPKLIFLTKRIFNDMVVVILGFMQKLNLNIKCNDDDSSFGTNFFLSRAENESDFLFFVNLVDLTSEVFFEIDIDLLQLSAEKLLEYFIKLSYEHQMISGFYKLLKVIFIKLGVSTDYQNLFKESTCKLISRYLADVLELVNGFSDELQLSCIYMIFNVPSFFIKNLFNEMSPLFKIAFNIGLTDLTLAFCALDTLENWIKSINYDHHPVDFIIKNVINYLEPYLTSEESLIELVHSMKKRNKKYNINSKIVNEDNNSLEDFQSKILLFMGSIDNDLMFDYLHEKSNQTNASWKKNKKDFNCDLYFPDVRLNVHFDTLLPRIVELTQSGDLKVKISACELLHTMITIMLGKKLIDDCFNEKLCYVVLRLGCDQNEIVRSLYHPFVIQLTHYLSSSLMKDSRVPLYFLDSLFRGLIEEIQTSMREFCGLYLKEFVQWSLRQHTSSDSTNIRIIVRRITSFALFPSKKKRLAASIAFNNLYTIFRENVNIVNVYWLEFLHAFIKSLDEDDKDDVQTINALSHVEKVVTMKKNVFMAKSIDRRKPPGFTDETLRGTISWLFRFCGSSLNTTCRRICMKMFENFITFVPNYEILEIFKPDEVNKIAIKGLDCEFNIDTSQSSKAFLKCLDFYGWIVRTNFSFVDHDKIANSLKNKNDIFFKTAFHFTSTMTGPDLKSVVTSYSLTHKEAEDNVDTLNELTFEVLNFLITILSRENNSSYLYLPCADIFFNLIVYCLIEPSKIELTTMKLKIFENLPRRLESLLIALKEKLTESQILQFNEIFMNYAKPLFLKFTNYKEIINDSDKDIYYPSIQFFEGLLLIKKTKIIDIDKKFNLNVDYLNEKLNEMFEALKIVVMNCEMCRKLDDLVLNYSNVLMKFLLNGQKIIGILNTLLLTFIMSGTRLIRENNSITHGEYFLETFKSSILEFMFNDPIETLTVLEKFTSQRINTDIILQLIDDLLLFAQTQQIDSEKSEILADEVIARFSFFSNFLHDMEKRKTVFYAINKKAVALKKDPTTALKTKGTINDFKLWLFSELQENNDDLSKKTTILQDFATCLIHREDNDDNDEENRLGFLIMTSQLRHGNSMVYSNQLDNNELEKLLATRCFRALLKLLVVTNSITIYESVIKFAAGIYDYLSTKDNAKEYLDPYFSGISNEKALKSLKLVYAIFLKLTQIQERLDVLKRFLLPSLECSNSWVIQKFYELKAKELIGNVRIKLDVLNDTKIEAVERKKSIITQIACYNIFELLFVKHEVVFEELPDPLDTFNVKQLNQILLAQIMELRAFGPKNEDEKEITRLLHCAALSCCISLVSLKNEEKFYKFIFLFNKEKNQLLWERIVDCDRKYDFNQKPSSLREERKKLINIKKRGTIVVGDQTTSSYNLKSYELGSLTLLENLHAYDLNDTTVLAQAKKKSTINDNRLNLSFENDQLNDHECMPMLVGVLLHLYNDEIVTLPRKESINNDREVARMPIFLEKFRNGFTTHNDNVRIFLMKIVCNTKTIIMCYMKEFFISLCDSVRLYLNSNPLNYVVRDVLVMILESGYEPITNNEKLVAQFLMQKLVTHLPDKLNFVYKYNLEIYESLCRLFKNFLNFPKNLNDDLAKIDLDLVIQVIVVLLRSGIKINLLNEPNVKRWIENSLNCRDCSEFAMIKRFEAAGWLLNAIIDEDERDRLVKKLIEIFQEMQKKNLITCVKLVRAIYQGCPSEIKCKEFFKFTTLPMNSGDDIKAICFDLFYQRLPNISSTELPIILLVMNIKQILNDRIQCCEEIALKIVSRLVPLLEESDLFVYIELVINGYTGYQQTLLEHRRFAYEILIKAYTRCPIVSNKSNSNNNIGNACIKALILAVNDPADEIQKLILDFWRDNVRLPETLFERLLTVLNLYEPNLHDAFTRFFCLMILELTRKSIEDKRVMFEPLNDCNFRDYEILIPRRRLNFGSMAPLFAPSLASQINRFSIINTQTGTFTASLRLMATKDFSFEPTAVQFAVPQDLISQSKKLPEPSQNKLSRRLITDPEVVSQEYENIVAQKKNEFHEKLITETKARRNSAKVYRKYRIGDFPDVEITNATFIECLRQFITKDWLACKNFAVALVCNLIDRLKGSTNEKYQIFINNLTSVFKRVVRLDEETITNNFVLVVLEVLLRVREIKIDVDLIYKVCKKMNLNALGVLLMEQVSTTTVDDRENLDEEAPPLKKSRLDPFNKKYFIQMANLYKSIGITDVAVGIFRQTNVFSMDLQKASLAQLEGDWKTTQTAYKIAYDSASEYEKDHCLAGELESLAQLGNWQSINKKIKTILNEDYNNVWNDPNKEQLLPWIFDAQLQASLKKFNLNENPDNLDFIQFLNSFISSTNNIKLKRDFGEEIAVFLLIGAEHVDKVEQELKCCLDKVREDWIRSSSMSENLRFKALLKLCTIFNIDAYTKVLKSTQLENKTSCLLDYWNNHLPKATDDLLFWNKLVTYRLTFAQLLHEKIENDSSDSPVLNDLKLSLVNQRMRVIESAIFNKNTSVLKKYLVEVDTVLQNFESDDFYNEFELNASKYKLINAEITENNIEDKLKNYVNSWKFAEELKNKEQICGSSLQSKIKFHLFHVASSLLNQTKINKRFFELCSGNEFILQTIKKSNNDSSSISTLLKKYSFNNLKESCIVGQTIERAENYTKFGKYCYNLAQESNFKDIKLNKHLVQAILNGMIMGSLEANQYFSCLLNKKIYQRNDEIKRIFTSLCEKIESWMFLSSKDQIISYSSDEFLTDLLLPLMKKIFQDYPFAIIYDIQQLIETNKLNFAEMNSKFYYLINNSGIKNIVEGLHHVCQPESYLNIQLQDLFIKKKEENFQESVEKLLEKLYGNKREQGNLYNIVLCKYKDEIIKLKNMNFANAKNYARMMDDSLQRDMKKRLDKHQVLQLKDYSPYLANFSGKDCEIEIPGQYDGKRKPMPRYHVKLAKFDRFVQVIKSKCCPIKIEMIGNDAKNYGYLVKCGEDLRQDQRLQQIFKTINKTLDGDVNCKKRYSSSSSLSSYHVLPLSKNLGLIQWVEETKSLKEFVEFSIVDKNILIDVASEYHNWIMKAENSSSISKCYRKAVIKYNKEEVVATMTRLTNKLGDDLLKKTFWTISPTVECFISLRHKFVTSYATMCVAHWLTGVGDRHPENILIEVNSGKCVGIDFGLAFGLAIDQSVPELVPFRLTSQILGLLKPFDENGLFGITMTRVLDALRKESGPMSACLDVFVHEPLNWTKDIEKNIKEEEEINERQELEWIPQNKIKIVKKKLNGANPCLVMLEELKNVHFQHDQADKVYEMIFEGTNYPNSKRSKLKEKEILTAEEQVSLLLEMAKDFNLLGRMYVGWSPFV